MKYRAIGCSRRPLNITTYDSMMQWWIWRLHSRKHGVVASSMERDMFKMIVEVRRSSVANVVFGWRYDLGVSCRVLYASTVLSAERCCCISETSGVCRASERPTSRKSATANLLQTTMPASVRKAIAPFVPSAMS